MPDHTFKAKSLEEILAPRHHETKKKVEWQGRPGEIKPLWAILGDEPPYDWQPPEATEERVNATSGASKESPIEWWNLPASIKRARQIADEERAKRRFAHNDLGDAMRHAEWMRRTVQETNPFTAWLVGTGHELDNLLLDGQPLEEVLMDLHNNRVGRDAGQNNRPVDNGRLRTLPLQGNEYNPYSE